MLSLKGSFWKQNLFSQWTWAVGAEQAFMLMNEARAKGVVYEN